MKSFFCNKNNFLLLAILIFYSFLQPTPDDYTFPLFFIGFVLILYCSLAFFNHLRSFNLFTLFFVYYFLYQFSQGLILEYASEDIFRDTVCLIFFFLIYFVPRNRFNENDLFNLKVILIISGLIFSIKYFFQISNFEFFNITNNFQYFLLSPLVLFSALYLFKYFLNNRSIYRYIFLFLSIFIFYLFIYSGLRLYILIYILVCFTLILLSRGSIFKYFLIFFVLITSIVIYFTFDYLFTASINKTINFGFLNGRNLELKAIFDFVIDNCSILFGCGLGSLYSNPVTNFSFVNFSHMMFPFFFLKGGLFGLILIFLYLINFFKKLLLIKQADEKIILFFSLLPSLMLYDSYRYFGFGLLVLLIFLRTKSDINSNIN